MPDFPSQTEPETPASPRPSPFIDPSVEPAQDLGFRDRRLPGMPAGAWP